MNITNEHSCKSGLIFMLTFLVKPSSLDPIVPHDFISTNPILNNGQPIDGEQKWLHDFSHSVKPRACHSHNDYWRPYPLFSALAAGCSSVEADVWHTGDKKDLLIGHDEASLTPGRTLTSMYLRPLLNILDSINLGLGSPHRGIFRTDPNASLVLLIDVKSESNNTWPILVEQLLALREKGYLTRYEDGSLEVGPITVVGTGNIVSDRTVFTSTNADPKYSFDEYHDTFLDAPLALLPQAIDIANSNNPVVVNQDVTERTWSNEIAYYASASFKSTIGSVITGFSPSQLSTLRSQINAAARLGLTSRYWDTPDWPVGYRDYVWGVLEWEGVGILNVDDLEGAARRGWDATGGTWLRDVAWMIAVGVWVVSCGVVVVVLGWKQRRVARTRYLRRSS